MAVWGVYEFNTNDVGTYFPLVGAGHLANGIRIDGTRQAYLDRLECRTKDWDRWEELAGVSVSSHAMFVSDLRRTPRFGLT